MSSFSQSARRILTAVGYGASLLAPLLLLLNLSVGFPEDWSNHLWMVNYYGEYFRQHGALPTVMNFPPAVGFALPVFYAWLMYPVLGVLAAVIGAALALRVALVGMLAIQFFALVGAGRKIFGQVRVAYVVAVSVIWATYSLTNLYNRGALAEYFATGFFVTALAFAASAAMAPAGSSRWLQGWLAGFFLILTVGTHAPTAVLAAGFVALLGAGLALAWLRGRLKVTPGTWARLGLVVLAGALVLAPWIYASGLWGNHLFGGQNVPGFYFRLEGCDSFWGRFAPFPYDALSAEDGTNGLGTSYLEAPVNVVLLILLGWNLELCRRDLGRARSEASAFPSSPAREILAVAIGWFVFLAAFSLSPRLAGGFKFFAPYIQYVYRLVSHCNAALLVGVFASGYLVARHAGYRRHRHQTSLVLAVCLTVAVLGLWIKLQHAAVVVRPAGDRPASDARRRMEMAPAYTLPSLARELTGDEVRSSSLRSFPVGEAGAQFGEVSPVRIELKEAGWVRTNALVFPWLKLEQDGQMVGTDRLASSNHFLAVYLPAGVHDLRAIWQPDRTWLVLNRLSRVVFVLILFLTVGWAVARLFSRSRGATPT